MGTLGPFRGGKGVSECPQMRTTDLRRVRTTDETKVSPQPQLGSATVSDRPTCVRAPSRLYGRGRRRRERSETHDPPLLTSPFISPGHCLRTANERPRGTVLVGPAVPTVTLRLSEDPLTPSGDHFRMEVRSLPHFDPRPDGQGTWSHP